MSVKLSVLRMVSWSWGVACKTTNKLYQQPNTYTYNNMAISKNVQKKSVASGAAQENAPKGRVRRKANKGAKADRLLQQAHKAGHRAGVVEERLKSCRREEELRTVIKGLRASHQETKRNLRKIQKTAETQQKKLKAAEAKRAATREKRSRFPNNPYVTMTKEMWKEAKDENRATSVPEMGRLCGARWKNMSEQEKVERIGRYEAAKKALNIV